MFLTMAVSVAIRKSISTSQIAAGNVMLAKGDWNEALIEEMMYFPNSEFKDQVDALSGAFRMLAGGGIKIAKAVF